ncbi:MAG: alpha/beta hydrolase, partial [Gammaproteobacteria bacterium]|nr:alpha/beta hydrolase [Gammaproteobacteria bacterium]
FSWRYQIAVLSKKYKVVAPDLRGYNLTEKKGPFDILTLCNDVRDLIQNLGYKKAIIVGHDWGAMILWSFALKYPNYCEKLIALNVPFISWEPLYFKKIWSRKQFKYMKDFQTPDKTEKLIGSDIGGFIRHLFSPYSTIENFISDEELAIYVDALSKPGAITFAIEYYRQFYTNTILFHHLQSQKILTPTLLIIGTLDHLFTPDMIIGMEKRVPNATIKKITCGHWAQQEAPKETNQLILDFLTGV